MSQEPAETRLYVPRFNVMEPDDVRPFVEAVATAQLVTVGADGLPDATFLPVLWEGDRLVGHLARANAHWRRIVEGSPALAVVTGPDTYVSPSWYATKAEHGKVVPTWNYSVVHLRGRIVVHDDPAWVLALVTRLTDRHEQPRDEPWAVTDAPERLHRQEPASHRRCRGPRRAASRPRPSSARTAPPRTGREWRPDWRRTASIRRRSCSPVLT